MWPWEYATSLITCHLAGPFIQGRQWLPNYIVKLGNKVPVIVRRQIESKSILLACQLETLRFATGTESRRHAMAELHFREAMDGNYKRRSPCVPNWFG
jgi:hypothetical protein